MLNQVVLVGRLTKDVKTRKEEEKEFVIMTLAIPRSFKNSEGIYETDFISCYLYNNIATNTAEYCRKGDIVGVKGRLQTKTIETEEGNKEYQIYIVAEKVTFLSSRKENESND